jgi:hypothetical protein
MHKVHTGRRTAQQDRRMLRLTAACLAEERVPGPVHRNLQADPKNTADVMGPSPSINGDGNGKGCTLMSCLRVCVRKLVSFRS